MQIGISTAAFYSRAVTEDALVSIRALGARACEVFLDSYCEYEPEFGTLLAARAEELGLSIRSIHAMATQFEPQLFSLSKRQREDAWMLYEKVLAQGRRLGAKKYVMHGPATMRGALRNSHLQRIGPILSDLADLAGQYGLRLCYENVSWCMFNHPGFVSELLHYCHSSNLGFTLDIKQAARSGYDPFEYLHAMGERVSNVHLCDYTRGEEGLTLSMPGRGSFDFARLSRELRAVGYAGDAMIEPYSDLYGDVQELGDCLKAMRELMEY